jgi:hypothetical protein
MRFAVILLLLAACSKRDDAQVGHAAELAASAMPKAASETRPVLDFLKDDDRCSFGHRGALLDLGDPSMRARMTGNKLVGSKAPEPEIETREHEGASWVSLRGRSLELSFVSDAEWKPEAGLVVEARVRGGSARSASVYLNGKPFGTLPLTKGDTTIVSVKGQGAVLRGSNELLIRLNGGPKGAHDLLAEIDWIRVGPHDGDAPYSAPTRADAITSVAIGGTTKRSVSLRAPGFARCTGFLPSGSVLEGFVGVTGGEAEAEVRVLVDRAEPRVVGTFHLGRPGDPPGFRPIALPLGDVGSLGAVELVAKSSSKGARVAFAEARVMTTTPPAPPATPNARGVILVVLGSVSRRSLGIYNGPLVLPELAALGGTIFEAHRSTSSFAAGALASMITGLSPREHGASDGESALSPSVSTVSEAARRAGVMTAMFSANPTTTHAFGFARGWETFLAHLPGVDEAPALSVFEDAGRWLDSHKTDRFFVVIHARGGHPPWDVASEELKDLPPAGYNGSLEPSHGGEALAKARKAGGGRLFAEPDRERAFALHDRALLAHDAALGALIGKVRAMGREKDTVFIVTSDVGLDAASHVPFLEDESLEEGALAVPLIVRAPEGPRRRERVPFATSAVDIAPTILEALSLPPPSHLRGESLLTLAARERPAERPLVAMTTTRFSAKWGTFAVVGARERESKVCNLALDPDCLSDVRATHPFAAEALHALAWTELVAARPGAKPATAIVADGPTSAALKAWGR